MYTQLVVDEAAGFGCKIQRRGAAKLCEQQKDRAQALQSPGLGTALCSRLCNPDGKGSSAWLGTGAKEVSA